MNRDYPPRLDEEFPTAPRTFVDEEGRDIEVSIWSEDDREATVQMYLDFDPGDRAQGIPPVPEDAIRDWLDTVLDMDSIAVLGRYEGEVVGHAMLVPGEDGEYELAIFVLHEYQGAGIGTELMRTLLGEARAADIEHIWLTVERWNNPAVALYKKIGFATCDSDDFDIEMAIRL
jgi:ribosomal protein S18 acetylase RimI-like enzyme